MRVYVVTKDTWDGKYIEGVFITEKLAQKEVEKLSEENPFDNILIDEYEVILEWIGRVRNDLFW